MKLARGEEEAALWPNTGLNVEVAKPPTFNREARQVLGFLIACRLYIRVKMREATVEKYSGYCYIYKKNQQISKKKIL